MAARNIAATIGVRIIAESIPDGCIGRPLKTGCIQADKMIGGQLNRVVAFGAEDVFILDMFFMLARIIAIILAGSAYMTALAVGSRIEASVQPVRCCLAAVAADIRAGSAARIIRKNTGLGIIGCQPGNTGRSRGIEMDIGVGAGAVVTGAADARNPIEAVVQTVGTVAVRAKISGRCRAVGWIIVARGAVGQDQGRAGRMAIIARPADTSLGGPQQIGSMAQGAGNLEVSGDFVTVGSSAAPGRVGMGGFGRVAVFTAVDQISHRNIKTRVAAGAAGSGGGMAFLTVFQIGIGVRAVQRRIRKRQRMRGAGSAGMTAGSRPVGIGEPGRKAARCRGIGGGPALGKIVADRAGGVLL